MTNYKKLTLKDAAQVLSKVPCSITRLPKLDPTFPPLEKVGRSVFIDQDKFYEWLSAKAGETITPADKLMTSKHLEEYYSKSHTWIWLHIKAGNLPKPFKINRSNYWIERVILNDVEEVA